MIHSAAAPLPVPGACELCGNAANEFVILEVCETCVTAFDDPNRHHDQAAPHLLVITSLALAAWAFWLAPAAIVYALMR